MKKIGYIKGERVVEIPTASLDDLAVTEAKLGPLAVTEDKIGADSVTKAKLDAAIDYWLLQRAGVQLFQGTGLTLQAWTDVDLDTVMAVAVSEVPDGAIGVIMSVRVTDAATPLLQVRADGEAGFYYHHECQQHVTGINAYAMLIVPLGPGNIIEWHFSGGSGAGTAHARLRGWVISP